MTGYDTKLSLCYHRSATLKFCIAIIWVTSYRVSLKQSCYFFVKSPIFKCNDCITDFLTCFKMIAKICRSTCF